MSGDRGSGRIACIHCGDYMRLMRHMQVFTVIIPERLQDVVRYGPGWVPFFITSD